MALTQKEPKFNLVDEMIQISRIDPIIKINSWNSILIPEKAYPTSRGLSFCNKTFGVEVHYKDRDYA